MHREQMNSRARDDDTLHRIITFGFLRWKQWKLEALSLPPRYYSAQGGAFTGQVPPSQLRHSQEGPRLQSQRMRSVSQSDEPAGGARATSNLPTEEEQSWGAAGLRRGKQGPGGGRGRLRMVTVSWFFPKALTQFIIF